MDTKRCFYCYKLLRADAEMCNRCGHAYSKNASKVSASFSRSASPVSRGQGGQESRGGRRRHTTMSLANNKKVKAPVLGTHDDEGEADAAFPQRSIPPASPHRAGHYSGLHPEDQPYQSAIMSVPYPGDRYQRPSAPEQPPAPMRQSNTRSLAQQANETAIQAGQAIAPTMLHADSPAVHSRETLSGGQVN